MITLQGFDVTRVMLLMLTNFVHVDVRCRRTVGAVARIHLGNDVCGHAFNKDRNNLLFYNDLRVPDVAVDVTFYSEEMLMEALPREIISDYDIIEKI